jgi:hypothetical protein
MAQGAVLSDEQMFGAPAAAPKVMSDDEMFGTPKPKGFLESIKEKAADLISQEQHAEMGAAQGLTAGYAPNIIGAAKSLGGANYIKSRDEAEKMFQAAQAAHPKSYLAGEVGAPIAAGLLTGGASAAPEVGVLGSMARTGLRGAAQGLITNPGNVPGEISGPQIGERLGNAAASGLIAAPFGALGGLGSKLNPQSLEKKATEQAFKSFNPQLKDVMKNQGKIQQIGKTALDEGLISKNVKSYEELAEASKEALEANGKKLESWINRISDAAEQKAAGTALTAPGSTASVSPKVGVNKDLIIKSLKAETEGLDKVPGAGSKFRQINSVIKDFEENHPGIISIKDANDLKIKLGEQINWNRPFGADIPPKEVAQRAIYTHLKQGVEDAADAVSDTLGAGAKAAYIADKAKYGDLKTLSKIADKSAGRDFSNRFLSLSDYQGGQTGGIIASMMNIGSNASASAKLARVAGGAALGAVGNKVARTFGNQPMAAGMYKASKSPLVGSASGLLRGAGALPPGLILPTVQTIKGNE